MKVVSERKMAEDIYWYLDDLLFEYWTGHPTRITVDKDDYPHSSVPLYFHKGTPYQKMLDVYIRKKLAIDNLFRIDRLSNIVRDWKDLRHVRVYLVGNYPLKILWNKLQAIKQREMCNKVRVTYIAVAPDGRTKRVSEIWEKRLWYGNIENNYRRAGYKILNVEDLCKK